uniref:Uncharacterized protein n=1 Tax=Oryza barthii TaxID=65489 RepID=A0A0D3H1G4_9ORYZ
MAPVATVLTAAMSSPPLRSRRRRCRRFDYGGFWTKLFAGYGPFQPAFLWILVLRYYHHWAS